MEKKAGVVDKACTREGEEIDSEYCIMNYIIKNQGIRKPAIPHYS